MPTVNLGAPTTTGRWGGSAWQGSPFGWEEYTGTTYQPGARWASVPVPRGAVIIAATLAFSVGGTGVAGARAVGVHQVDNAPTMAAGQQATTRTPTGTWPGTTGAMSVSLTAGVQALVDRAGWASGNALVARWSASASFENTTLSAVSLTIVYEDPSIPVTGTVGLVMGVAGAVTLDQPVAGTAALVMGVAGAVSVFSGPTGAAAMTMGVAGAVTARRLVSGTVALTMGAAGSPALHTTVTGTAAMTMGVAGAVSVKTFPGWQWLVKSPEYVAAVSGRRARATMTVDVLDPTGTTLLATFGGAAAGLDATRPGFEGVAVHHRGTSGQVRWSAELTSRDPSLMPAEGDLLDPLTHNLVRVWWWVHTPTLGWQRVPAGTGTVDTVTVTDDTRGYSLRVIVRDLMADIARARWDTSVPLALTPLSEAQARILTDRAPWAQVALTPTTEMTPEDWAHGGPDSDPAIDLARLAYAAGAVAHVDRMGVYTNTRIVPREEAPLAARFVEGLNARLISIANATLDLDEVCNAATFRSASSDVEPPVWGSWEVEDAAHPLWVGRRRYSRDLSNALMRTSAQCVSAARNYVREHAVTQRITIEHTPRVELDAGQAVEVSRPRAGVTGRYTVVDWDLPSPSGPQRTVLEAERRWF